MNSVKLQADTERLPRRFESDRGSCGHERWVDPWLEFDSLMRVSTKNFSMPFSSVLEKAKQMSLFVDIDSDVIGGSPRIGGTRIPVHMVLSAIEEYGTIQGAAKSYGALTEDQVRDALKFSANVLECPFEHESTATD